ncbi:MAG: 4-(cytidine 5'-diphospho)-2-C-methyl-D-erythritol kinase [Gemmatimonadetes bacterium]|jgi:4-diphosphocytidyl-2-C-methyl-D-erythritol kinase|nr:4-(cytidine 5'-diphospho)-2-C-methyl-D-erythritol kinase [Gemmatimonadota bacterium]MBT5056802.1 4-(cytidine 5'-diphospho)-2-C-methyl-D-erythritol kinase [Gemmatimonadota bacterium]MBT5143511.1 4-(cytidine 5'-diphospho)-2-C-methyl-D-erythritol kinase [Gemmatimonadota bacterium]MBT5590202.1 4-(cytidine 5'-diphospho)-2-C-methyl-D-erythritol kinase [Gemmatimonadota bacterium]MBT5963665.1 4-(cytidine 5'-diphospho)-2-C-methyl-D-erythritol kinase [Gemmatimonadota bacterium]
MNSLHEVARAKLNLGLKVTGRREDGFHNLISLFQTVDLCDELTLTLSAKLSLHCDNQALPNQLDNLAWKAADLFLREVGGRPVHIDLVKRIPMGAGLGGGSADAAAVLRGLNRLASRPVSLQQLQMLGAQLGSDVPFALQGGTAWVEGRGELLTPVPWDAEGLDLHYLLVDPGIEVNTAWAYAQLAIGISRQNSGLSTSDSYLTFFNSARGGRVPVRRLLEVIDNDFQPVVERAKPIVARASQALAALTPLARSMTGSGSVVFGIYVDRIAARHAAEQLRRLGYPVFLCTPVPEPVSTGQSCGE